MKKFILEIAIIIATILVVIFSINIVSEENADDYNYEMEETDQNIDLAWGFPLDSIRIDTFRVKQNQNLSAILDNQGVSTWVIDQLAKISKSVFDVRKIRSGNHYYIINTDTINNPNYLVYQETQVDYIVYNLDSLNVYRGQKQIDTIRKSTAGIIETSLWNSLVENGNSPILSLKLSDIFAWTIDFFGIQKGDEYKIIYDELYIDGEFFDIGKIYATSFVNLNDTVHAYHFKSDNQDGYFDNVGQSLQKQFLKAPLSFSRISSRFSNNRLHPVLKYRRPHQGVDYAAPMGTPVYAIGDGVIVKKAYQKGGGGNYLTIKHNSVYTSQYMHLNGYAKGIAVGKRVKQNELIGYVGKTGLATGPHLDFRIYKNGSPVDPLTVKSDPVEPIDSLKMDQFCYLRDSLNQLLTTIPVPQPELLTSK